MAEKDCRIPILAIVDFCDNGIMDVEAEWTGNANRSFLQEKECA